MPSPDVPLAILEDHVAQSDGLLGADFWERQLAELQQVSVHGNCFPEHLSVRIAKGNVKSEICLSFSE